MSYFRSLGKKRNLLLFMLLFLGAIAGNYLNLDLLPGVEIMFGSIAVLMVAVFFHPLLGAAIALIACRLVAPDPYYMAAFTCEALFVGFAVRHRQIDVMLLDLLYWLVLGIPLLWLMVRVDSSVALLLSLKVLINGVANSLVVTIIIFLIKIKGVKIRFPGGSHITLRYLLLILLVALVIGSNLVGSFTESRGTQVILDDEIKSRLEANGGQAAGYLTQWKQTHQFVLEELANIASAEGMTPSDRLQAKVEDIERAWPDMAAVYVCDKWGTTIAYSSALNNHLKTNIGKKFADREYFQMIRSTGKPFVSSAFVGREGLNFPVMVLALPLKKDQQFIGGVVGVVDLSYNSLLSPPGLRFETRTSLIDKNGRVVATTRPELRAMDKYLPGRGGTLRSATNGLQVWKPDSGQYEVVRWLNEVYIKRVSLGQELGWTIVLEERTNSSKTMIIRKETEHLAILILMLIFAILLAELVSRHLSKPISSLAELTTGLPDRIADNDQKQWPTSPIFEINSLVSNLTAMANTMESTFFALRESVERYQEEKDRALVTLYSIGDGVIVTDENGLVEYLNPVAEQLTGWESNDAAGQNLPEIFRITNEVTGGRVDNPVKKCLAENNVVALTEPTTLTRKDGITFSIENSAAPIKNRDGRIIGVILVFHDVTEKKKLMTQMSHQAYHDALTSLPNRLLFNDRLNVAVSMAKRDGQHIAVMFLDLDRFKMVNDMLGHAKGDMLLKDVARRLADSVRITDTLARLGGDEFTLVVSQLGTAEDAQLIGEKILQVFEKPFVLSDHEFHLSASIGIAIFPHHGTEPQTLMMHADRAMYYVKEQGGNNCKIYSREMDVNVEERLIRENNLRRAVENQEFVVYYQPIVDVETGQATGLEALLRWEHPDLGLVMPKDFIPLAEEIGLIEPLGDWVLQQACAQNQAWQAAGYAPVRVTVNLSAKQFQKGNLVKNVGQILQETGLEPHWLELEITETVAMQNMDYTIKTLQQLRNMGVRFAIDDFGTGYSSLSYLRRFPIHTLKIDRSFIADIVGNPEDAAIVSTIIVLANNLNLEIVAEGVENHQQVEFLKNRNCRQMQGFFFGKPMPKNQVQTQFLRMFT